MRVGATLADEQRAVAPTIHSWRLDYTCSSQE